MKIAFGSDERTALIDFLAEDLRRRGHDVELAGPPAGQALAWAEVAARVATQVARGDAEQGLLCCWTGTGMSIAANKVPGIRAALCWDAETAAGARRWNDANILCLSLRSTSQAVAGEILDAWFAAEPDPSEAASLERLRALDGERA